MGLVAATSADVVSNERSAVFISGFMHLQNNSNVYSILFAILKALLPSLSRHDICSARVVRSRTAAGVIIRGCRKKIPLSLYD